MNRTLNIFLLLVAGANFVIALATTQSNPQLSSFCMYVALILNLVINLADIVIDKIKEKKKPIVNME